MGVIMKLKASIESIQEALRHTRMSSLHPSKGATDVFLIPSLAYPFEQSKLQESLEKATGGMMLLDASESQADTLLYAEDRYFSLYQKAIEVTKDAQLFLLCLQFVSQENILIGSSVQTSASCNLLFSQLCAALRASANGKISLILPSVSTLQEIDAARQLIGQAMKKLKAQSVPFDEAVSLGIVLGTPASLLLSRKLIEAVDFVTVDTDLLSQLSLNSTPVSGYFNQLLAESAEAILRLAEIGIGNAHALGRVAMVSGSMTFDSRFLPHLLAMGVDGLIVPLQRLGYVKGLLRRLK